VDIAFFGSSLVSAYWNGAATYYRGIIRALHQRGHRITFYEPDAYERQRHRDMDNPPWATVVVYPVLEEAVREAIHSARTADLIVKASGVGVFDELLERELLSLKNPSTVVAFWDVDAPATLERLRQNADDPFATLIPDYDLIFTYGGGQPVVRAYCALGAIQCVPIYNALDPSTHYPVLSDERFIGDLGFLGNRLPDRESRVEEFFLKPAASLPEFRFLLGGAGWGDKPRSSNVCYFDHIYTSDHNAFNSTPRTVINISRDSMAQYGFSPATRIFEAAGAAACIITDAWEGIEMFFEPGSEILVARNGGEVAALLRSLTVEQSRKIGAAAYKRVLLQHTYEHRAAQVDMVLNALKVDRVEMAL
jgi:spore maturation protein CgeB